MKSGNKNDSITIKIRDMKYHGLVLKRRQKQEVVETTVVVIMHIFIRTGLRYSVIQNIYLEMPDKNIFI